MVLKLTRKQLKRFEHITLNLYIKELYQHVVKQFPEWTAAMDKQVALTSLKKGFLHAKSVGLTKRGTTHLYIDLMVLLGERFYDDIQYRFLSPKREESLRQGESRYSHDLHAQITDYLDHVIGDNNQHLIDALTNLACIERLLFKKEDTFNDEMQEVLMAYYPEKTQYIGAEIYQHFIQWGRQRALNEYTFQTLPQQATYILLMFFLGQYFDSDPFCSWLNWPQLAEDITNNRINFAHLSHHIASVIINKGEANG